MSFIEKAAEFLGLEDPNEDELLDALKETIDEKRQWENRFKALVKITGCSKEQTQQAFDSVPSSGKEQLLSWLDPETSNFMGSGMGLMEFMLSGDIRRFRGSFGSQKNTEQRRRLNLIIRASKALHDIREVNIFATGFCEMAIEDVIKGDLRNLKRWKDKIPAEWASESNEYNELWAPFTKIIHEAIDTWPEPEK